MAQKFDNDIFYHYTDFQALDGILRRAQLRVNNVLNMNDAAEMRLFMSGLCQAVVKRLLADGEKDLADEVRQLFEEELKKFRPSLEIDQVEDTVYSNNLSDVTDLMDEMLKEMKEHQ